MAPPLAPPIPSVIDSWTVRVVAKPLAAYVLAKEEMEKSDQLRIPNQFAANGRSFGWRSLKTAVVVIQSLGLWANWAGATAESMSMSMESESKQSKLGDSVVRLSLDAEQPPNYSVQPPVWRPYFR